MAYAQCYTQCCMFKLHVAVAVAGAGAGTIAACYTLLVYLLIPTGAECIIRLQRFAIVEPVDAIDRRARCRAIENCRSARIDNLYLR